MPTRGLLEIPDSVDREAADTEALVAAIEESILAGAGTADSEQIRAHAKLSLFARDRVETARLSR